MSKKNLSCKKNVWKNFKTENKNLSFFLETKGIICPNTLIKWIQVSGQKLCY